MSEGGGSFGWLSSVVGVILIVGTFGVARSCDDAHERAASERSAEAADEARDALAPRLAAHDDSITELESRLDALEDENDRLTRQANFLRSRVDDLESRLEDLEDRRGR